MCEQLRVIDKKRLIKYVGKLDDEILCQMKRAINVSLVVKWIYGLFRTFVRIKKVVYDTGMMTLLLLYSISI